MDPLSITVAVLRITTTCVAAAKELNEIHVAWKRAPVTVSSLCSQLKLTSASLSQIQSLLLNDTDVLQAKPALVETLDTTLTSCLVLSACLEKYMLKITKGVLENSRLDWKAKFKTLWNEDEVKELQRQLHQQHAAISTLVGLLQMDSLTEMKKLTRKHGKILQRIANDTQRMREAHSIEAAESILGTDDSSSIFSKLPIRNNISDHHSGCLFESDLLKSDVYSKALNNTMKQTVDIEPDDANTVADDGMTMYNDDSDRTIDSPLTKEDSASALMAGTPTFAPLSASFTSAINYLRVGTIEASILEDYTAQSPGELSLKCEDYIVALRKLDEWRYLGGIQGTDPYRTGTVDRRKLEMRYRLNDISHTADWWASPSSLRSQKSALNKSALNKSALNKAGLNKYGLNKAGLIMVDAVELDNVTGKHVDAILDFSACSDLRLVGLSAAQREQCIEEIIQEEYPEIPHSVEADCRTFKELQNHPAPKLSEEQKEALKKKQEAREEKKRQEREIRYKTWADTKVKLSDATSKKAKLRLYATLLKLRLHL
ncbi:unnamed protein product [Alternaria alternata]